MRGEIEFFLLFLKVKLYNIHTTIILQEFWCLWENTTIFLVFMRINQVRVPDYHKIQQFLPPVSAHHTCSPGWESKAVEHPQGMPSRYFEGGFFFFRNPSGGRSGDKTQL
jgi:hypothetical protein